MSRAKFLAVVVLVSVLAAGLIATAQAQPKTGMTASAAPASYKPVQSVHQMMEGQNKLFREIKASVIDNSMKDAMLSAWILAEVANSNQYQHDDPEYRKLAVRMSEQCAELGRILKKGEQKAAMEQVSAIGQTCGACHDKFKKD